MAETVLQIRNLTKRIGNKVIVDKLNFEVNRGEVFGFLGPNGAGKTTTIRMMVGLMGITEGDVVIEGESIARNFEKAIVKVGAIVENPEMYKYLTGYQNLLHFARMVPDVTKERIDEIVRLVGLNERIQDKVSTYSLGMRQRLGVAQAILHKPSLLILDEPTNGLDPAGIRELRDYLYTLTREEGISVIVSSHLLSEMEMMCDRVAIIHGGKLVDVQSVKNLMKENSQKRVLFDVNDIVSALQLSSTFGNTNAKETEGQLECVLEREEIPHIIEHFLRGGVKIYGVKTIVPTLEDKFLQLTGGIQND